MSEIALSKLQYVVAGLVYNASLFNQEDLAHLSHCEIKLANTTREENALIAYVAVYFDGWSYNDHKESKHWADLMPAEVRVVFLQDQNRKLTGEISLGFMAEDPISSQHLDYLRGW